MAVAAVGLLSSWAVSAAASTFAALGITGAGWALIATAGLIQLGVYAAAAYALQALAGKPTAASSAGQKLNTTKNNTSAVPIIYGENRIAGNIVFEATKGINNDDYYSIVVFADIGVSDILSAYAKEDPMTLLVDNKYALQYSQINGYLTSGSGMPLSDVVFVTDDIGTTTTGELLFSNLTISVSSGGGASNLTDANLSVGWAPTSFLNEWIKIIDNTSQKIETVRLYLGTKLSDAEYNFTLQYSDDNVIWTNASATQTNAGAISGQYYWHTITSTESNAHLYWRVNFTLIWWASTGEPASVYEVDATGEGLSVLSIPKDVAFIATHQKFSNPAHVSLDSITVVTKGKNIRTVTDTTISDIKTYSNNPSEILIDILMDYLSVQKDSIDTASFYEAKTFCTNNSLSCNICFVEQQSLSSAIEEVLSTFRGFLFYSNGKWYLKHDGIQVAVKTLTDSDIIAGSISIGLQPLEDTPNKITLDYINPEDEWQKATISVDIDFLAIANRIPLTATNTEFVTILYNDILNRDPDAAGLAYWVSELTTKTRTEVSEAFVSASLEGELRAFNIKAVDVRGCTNSTQSIKLAELQLNQLLYSENSTGERLVTAPLNVSFATTLKHDDLNIGDLVIISNDIFGFNRKFKILNKEIEQSGSIKVECREYFATHYKNQNGENLLV